MARRSKTLAEPSEKFPFRPASPDEAGLFYAQTPEQDLELGCIGHVRIDFGHGGKKFWHTWHCRGLEEWNSPEFKEELTQVVDTLRGSVLRDLPSMRSFCYDHGGAIAGGWVQNYGYVVETDRYRYCLRCNPIPGDYQAYLTCFDKQVQKMSQGQKSGGAKAGVVQPPKILEAFSFLAQCAERASAEERENAAEKILAALGQEDETGARVQKLQSAMDYCDCGSLREAVAVAEHLDGFECVSIADFQQKAKAELIALGLSERVVDRCFDFEEYAAIKLGWDDIFTVRSTGQYVRQTDESFLLSDYREQHQGMTMEGL